jgi:hypothetical protein
MSQLPSEQVRFTGVDSDTQAPQDLDTSTDVLPSAGHSSGLSPAVRQHLEERFQATGDAEPIAREIRARIAELDERHVPEDDADHPRLQAERALYVAQVSYLEDHLAVHGVRPDRGSSADWDETGQTRVAGEPLRDTSYGGRTRRARVYDTTR